MPFSDFEDTCPTEPARLHSHGVAAHDDGARVVWIVRAVWIVWLAIVAVFA